MGQHIRKRASNVSHYSHILVIKQIRFCPTSASKYETYQLPRIQTLHQDSTMETSTSSLPIETSISSHSHSVRLTLYQLIIVVFGCAAISFREGLLISTIRRNQGDPLQKQCTSSNVTNPNKVLTGSYSSEYKTTVEDVGYPTNDLFCEIPQQERIPHGSCPTESEANDPKQSAIRHSYHKKRLESLLLQSDNSNSTDDSSRTSLVIQFYEAMVHPALLIHPSPRRIAIIHDVRGQILPQVLQHTLVQEVIYILPESLKNTSLLTDTNQATQLVTVVYANDPIPYLQRSLPIDVLFVDVATYV